MYQYRVLPCPNFAQKDIDIIRQYGFLSYPYFLDNGFKTQKGLEWKKAVNKAKELRPLFFIANDNEPLKDLDILKKYCKIIILPLHDFNDYYEYNKQFEWIGFPNNPKLRNYKIEKFLHILPHKKKWWLGLHDYPVSNPGYILKFQGFDSTLPELYAGHFGKIWDSWRSSRKPINKLHWRPIFEQNVQNFKLFLDNLEPNIQTYLEDHLND